MRTFIIAEAGVNHNGSMELAFKLIDTAVAAQVDAIKFQTFKAENLVTKQAPKAEYQTCNTDSTESQYEMIRKLELTNDDHNALITYAKDKGIEFLSTPFDKDSLLFLTDECGLTTIKVSSGDITNAPFLLDIARSAKKIIISTGMSTLGEIEAALGVLAFGFTVLPSAKPQPGDFDKAFASESGQKLLKERVVILHCTTEYPAPVEEVNLQAIDTIAKAFGLPVGYSDHTKGIHIPIAAVARGASIIEKHFTLDKNLPGPDHKASLEPNELREMVLAIRDVEKSIGTGVKIPTNSEWKNRAIARKSLVAAKDMKCGEKMQLVCKRPGTGVTPFKYWQMKSSFCNRNYSADELIDV